MKNENIEQLQAEIQRLKSELENVERLYLDNQNKICQERDEAMMKLEDLEQEIAAYKGALRQLLTSLMFPAPGVCWLGTGDQAMDELIDQAIKSNGLNLAQSTHNRKVYVGYVKPKEE